MRRMSWLAVLGAVGLVGFALASWLFQSPATPAMPSWVVADEFILYSLSGYKPREHDEDKALATGETLHGFPVLGKVSVDNPAERRRLQEVFQASTARSGQLARCFIPRHGVRLRHGATVTDLVICFECLRYERRVGGNEPERHAYIAPSARPAFDAPLTAAGVPIAPD